MGKVILAGPGPSWWPEKEKEEEKEAANLVLLASLLLSFHLS